MVGGGIKRIEIKSVEKIFLIGVWLEGAVEKKKLLIVQVFSSLAHQNIFSLK